MPLDPVAKAFFDQLSAQPGPKLWELDARQGRELFVELMRFVGPKDVPIGGIADLRAPGPGGEIPLRGYTPVGAEAGVLPALVFFHGGGFVIGDLDTHDGLCRMLANEARARVIAADYRLAPEHKFPAAVEDARAVVCWAEAHAASLKIDAGRLAVGGDSAGANLAAVVAQMAKAKAAPPLAFQMLLFPVTQIGAQTRSMRDCTEGLFLERATLDWFFGHYLKPHDDRTDVRMSPLLAKDLTGLPPAFVMTAGYDPLHDEGLQYADKMRAAGVAVAHADYPEQMHDFIYLQAVLPQAGEAVRVAGRALRSALTAE